VSCSRNSNPPNFRGLGLRARAHVCSCASDAEYRSPERVPRDLPADRRRSPARNGGDTTHSMALGELETDLFPLMQRRKPCTGQTQILNRRWQHLLMIAQPPVRGRTRPPRPAPRPLPRAPRSALPGTLNEHSTAAIVLPIGDTPQNSGCCRHHLNSRDCQNNGGSRVGLTRRALPGGEDSS